jgi:hypothetical protein
MAMNGAGDAVDVVQRGVDSGGVLGAGPPDQGPVDVEEDEQHAHSVADAR